MFEKRYDVYKVFTKHSEAGVQFDAFFDAVPTCKELAKVLWDRGVEWLELATLAGATQLSGWQKDVQAHSHTARALSELANAIDVLDIPPRCCWSGLVPGLRGASLSIQSHPIYREIS